MFIHYIYLVLATSSASLIWRALKVDHPQFKVWVQKLPIVGNALSCGFCATLWFSLVAVLLVNPFIGYSIPFTFTLGALSAAANIVFAWFALCSGVLFVRSAIVVLLEAGAVLKHMHTENH